MSIKLFVFIDMSVYEHMMTQEKVVYQMMSKMVEKFVGAIQVRYEERMENEKDLINKNNQQSSK